MPQLKLKVRKAARRPLRLVAAIRPAVAAIRPAAVVVATTSPTRTSTQKGLIPMRVSE